MACDELVRIRNKRVCIGDLKHRVTLHDRDITPPGFEGADYGMDYTPIAKVWAAIKTTSGKTLFDGVSQDKAISHVIYIRFRKGLESELWVEFADGTRLKVAENENSNEANQFLLLFCEKRGSKTLEANLV